MCVCVYVLFVYVVVCFSNPGRGWDPGGTGFDSHSPVVEEEKKQCVHKWRLVLSHGQ